MKMKKVLLALGLMFSLGMGNTLVSNTPLVPAVSVASIEVNRSTV